MMRKEEKRKETDEASEGKRCMNEKQIYRRKMEERITKKMKKRRKKATEACCSCVCIYCMEGVDEERWRKKMRENRAEDMEEK